MISISGTLARMIWCGGGRGSGEAVRQLGMRPEIVERAAEAAAGQLDLGEESILLLLSLGEPYPYRLLPCSGLAKPCESEHGERSRATGSNDRHVRIIPQSTVAFANAGDV
ncbi:MAG: hypothetical protein R3D25_12680 [Geminicoccaceae bacterium]